MYIRASFIGLLIGFAFLIGRADQPQDKKDSKDKDYAAELPRIPATEPKDVLKTFKLAPGFKIELAASEPAIRSPVAIDFDEDGRMYVAEFPEYNQHGNPKFKERGAIKLLEDTDGDGVYDKVTTFADNLDSPVALCCWDGGVFVGAVPHIWYLKDTKGTGKADVRKIIYTGFARDKAGEAMLNSFRWGLDNRFHISTSAAGGNVKLAEAKDAKVFNVKGHAFLFDPRTLQFELVAGSGQHGMSMDDWGRKFTCDNSNPCHLLMYDGRYLLKNPYVQAPPPMLNIHGANQANYLKRISPNEPWRVVRTRLRLQKIVPGPTETGEVSGHFTGTTGVTVYRGDAFPAEHRGTLFVGEVSNNLVYHAKLTETGLTAGAKRVEDGIEFLASNDNWFRPAQFANAPDGTLYVIDHYREIVETVESIPPLILKHLHIESGVDRGRIYRVVPDGFKRPALPRLSKATTTELVKLLDHPNGWHRDTASRLLYQKQDRGAAPHLVDLLGKSKSSLAKVHALYALDGMNALEVKHVSAALFDDDPKVRVHAAKLTERFVNDVAMREIIKRAVSDNDLHVRFQLAFTLGAFQGRDFAHHLWFIAYHHTRDVKNSWLRFAVQSSASGRRGELLRLLADEKIYRDSAGGQKMLHELAVQIGAANEVNEVTEALHAIDELPQDHGSALMTSLLSKLPAKARERIAAGSKSGKIIRDLLADALRTALDEKQSESARVAAVRTLGLGNLVDMKKTFAQLLNFRQPESVQREALDTLSRFAPSREPAALILDAWPSFSPQVRATAAETIFARHVLTDAFLDAVEKGKIKTGEIDPARIALLKDSFDKNIRERANKLFKDVKLSSRKEVLAAYDKVLELKGEIKNGKEIFKKNCAACHRVDGIGEQIGAELGGIKDRGPEFILLNVLDPNREVLPKFITYVASTDTGLTYTGMITAETATSITIRRPDATSTTLLRVNIESLRSTGMSFMPEGLEKSINHQEMADLIAFLMSAR